MEDNVKISEKDKFDEEYLQLKLEKNGNESFCYKQEINEDVDYMIKVLENKISKKHN